MKKSSIIKKIMLALLITITIAVLQETRAYAEEYDEIKYKKVDSFEEYWELLESDDTNLVFSEEQLNGMEKIWYIDIDEPGWFVVSSYNTDPQGSNYYNVYNYMYSNLMFTDTVPWTYRDYKNIGGDIFSSRYEIFYYLAKGRYYYKIKDRAPENNRVFGDKNARLRFYLIPGQIELKVDEITYNDDNSVASINISSISKNIYELCLYDKEIKKSDNMFESSSHRVLHYQGSYDKDKILDVLQNGFELKENGTYTLTLRYNDDEYKNFYAAVTFDIDKIGAEASKIEAKSVKMSKTKASLKVGETTTLKATIKPKNVTDKTVTWKSSNKKVATVDKNGKVTAKKKGTCTITAVTSNGKKAKCKITVKK